MAQQVKNLPAMQETPGEGVSILGQRSLVGHSPWGHKELDATEQLSIAQHNCYFDV